MPSLSPSMACPNLTIDGADELAHFGIPVTSDVRLPSRWRLSAAGVPVLPLPDVCSHLFMRAVRLYRARLPVDMSGPEPRAY
uniref:Uncharacterized protein n=1 Tax=Aegilops tauschii subsp. strangulata TaxID=200361 RepID=A0A453SEQ3_AEGTS